MGLFLLFVVPALAIFVVWALRPDPGKLLLVYSQPGKWYWLKFHLMKFVIGRRQKSSKSAAAKNDDLMDTQFGGGGKRSIKDMDSKHKLPEDKARPGDCVFFDASNNEGYYFTLGTAQRKDDIINLFFLLRIPGLGTFIAPEMLTDTNVESERTDSEWATKSGFRVKCEEPMRKWTLKFQGQIAKSQPPTVFEEIGPMDKKNLENAELVPASFDLEWTNFGEHFDFDQDISPTSIAHSLAIEPWSRELFNKLKASHQSHYEQFGFLKGTFTVNGETYEDISMTSMRDHTITPHRDWSELRRYIMMIYHLDDGTCIHTSLISMPEVVFSHLEFGYVITPDKQKHAVDRIHLHLADVGEKKGAFPKHFNYTFNAGHLHYNVKVKIIETVSFKMGLDQASQVDENMAEFEVNGVNGRGFIEHQHRIHPF